MRHLHTAIAQRPAPVPPAYDEASLEVLQNYFRAQKPLVIMTGAGRESGQMLVDALIDCSDKEIDLLRLPDPSQEPEHCMTVIVGSIGFEADNLDLADLRQVLKMFLAYQKTHRRRTILFVENAQTASGWTLDLIDRLVSQEIDRQSGLLVLLSGDATLDTLLRDSKLPALLRHGSARLGIQPLDLNATRDYIHRCVETDGCGPISKVFQFDAVRRLHDISAGQPDTINQLVGQCLSQYSNEPITAELVENVAGSLDLVPAANEPVVPGLVPDRDQLVIRLDGLVVDTRLIESDKTLIGRSRQCDIKLAGKSVSRSHALLSRRFTGVRVVDLDSTNGTFVNGDRIEGYDLDGAAVIRIGDYEIDYVPSG